MSEVENYADIQNIANNDVEVLKAKGRHYGRSWIKRGGTGAFMMLARKWDRIENDVAKHAYDILTAIHENGIDRGDLLDDIQDLRRYLLLVESEYRCNKKYISAGQSGGGMGYAEPNGCGTACGQLKI